MAAGPRPAAQPRGQVHRRSHGGDRGRQFSVHYFRYGPRGPAVDELHQPYRGETTESLSVDLLRINHYFTRSQEERERKLAAPRVDNGKMKNREGVEERDRRLNEEPDDTILAFAPALRAALGLEAVAGSSADGLAQMPPDPGGTADLLVEPQLLPPLNSYTS